MSTTQCERIQAALANAEESAVARLCRAGVSLAGVDGTALVVMANGHPGGPVAATDGTATHLEKLQFALGEGPSLDAYRIGQPVLASHLAAETSWSVFTPAALQAGAGALFAVPLASGTARIGALSVYRRTPGGLDGIQLGDLEGLAALAVHTLVDLQAQAPPDELHETLAGNQGSVPWVVHQATGALAGHLSISPAEALVRLRAHAYATDRPIGEIAAEVLAGRLDLDDAG